MRPFWSGRTMLCAPEGEGNGGGGNSPPADPPPGAPPPEPPKEKKPDPKPEPETPTETLARDVARLKKHTKLDEPDVPAKKKESGLPVFSLFGDD
jgi:hypothetical protein